MTDSSSQFEGEALAGGEPLMAALYLKSGGQKFDLSREQFAAILEEVRAKYLPADARAAAVQELYASLRVEDLALARACAAGSERAWERFLVRYREKLYDVAGYITKESSAARELADSLYAELYGMSARDGHRVSKLASYTGRGSLEGWLRTVMAQEHVNRYRKQRRLVSLDEENEEGVQYAAVEPETAIAVEPRLEAAIDETLGALSSEDRFVLASYYLDDHTLADIARTLSVHESTISRKVDKLAKSLRKQILASLGRHGMSRRQAQEALEVDVRDLGMNIRSRLAQETPSGTFPEK
jgi:RNA polymerase sigma-70 factor, ECF subfamily